MDKLRKSIIYGSFKKILLKNFEKNTADEIWKRANIELLRLEKEYPEITGESRMMILPAAAIFSVLSEYSPENALLLLKEYGTSTGEKIAVLMHKVTSIPGVPEFLWRKMPMLMRKNSSPEKGYTRRIISETNELVAVDILSCPLHNAAVKIGFPEAAQTVCAMDKAYMNGFTHIRYTRTASVAEGEECCDYRLSYDKNKT